MPDDAVERSPMSGLTGLTVNPVALIAPAVRKSPTTQWRPSVRPSLVNGATDIGLSSDVSSLSLLRLVAHRMAAAAPLGSALAEVAGFVASVVKCDSCLLYVLEGDDLVLRASKNPHPGAADRVKLKPGQEIPGWTAQNREPVTVTQNATADPRFKLFNRLPEERFEAFLLAPLISRGHVVGVIHVQSREPHRYSDREIALVSTIGLLAGAETEMTRLEEQNSELAERLRARTVVERAKGLLQSDLGITEREAYQKIQRQSQQMRKAMKDIAEAIVLSHAVKCSQPD